MTAQATETVETCSYKPPATILRVALTRLNSSMSGVLLCPVGAALRLSSVQ